MHSESNSPENPELSELGRALFETGGSKPSGPWVPPTAEELHHILPQYEIIEMLGRGGMGAVYMGRQKSLDRPVAIKILSAALGEADVGFSERFKNEAKAMAKLNHPGIVSVYDFGEAPGGLLYIVMEYVDGTDVARMIAANGRLHTEHAMAITAHVCDALAYAHERGIIHRDIKPANIMVGYDGSVKVADFGLAKVDNPQGNTLGLTQTGMAMGTMHFMAPEMLVLGSAVDQRADIYAVGVMLYQMLTGKVPHGMFEMPSLQVPGLDPRYDSIIAQAMREDRDKRYGSASDLRKDLDAILTRPVVKADPKAANQAAAALPTSVRPKRPLTNQPYRSPQPTGGVRQAFTEKPASLAWLWIMLLVLGGLGVGAWKMSVPAKSAVTSAQAPSPKSRTQSITSPEEATKDTPFSNSLGMKFVPVPGTDVLFCIHETRHQDYAAFAAENPNVGNAWQNQILEGIPCGQENSHPVVAVNWNESQKFCEWISKKEGRRYRLPTDQEWSIAVGLGGHEDNGPNIQPDMLSRKESTKFPWGDHYPPHSEDEAGNYADLSYHSQITSEGYLEAYTDGFVTTAPVMSYRTNEFGLYDMGGNVWEWCQDLFNDSQMDRVLRGASFRARDRLALLSSTRSNRPPNYGDRTIGFRLVLSRQKAESSAASVPVPSPGSDVASSPWVRLFNGKDLTGWRVIGNSEGFGVDQGSIKTGGVRADLIYTGSGNEPAVFGDFELRMKVKTGQKGNSGLWFHLPPDIQSTRECDQSLQVQIDNSFDVQRTGSVVHIQALASSPVVDDNWFELRTLVQNKTVTVFVDGKQVNQWTQPESWVPPEKAALARMGSGLVGLESWEGNVWMRDIELRSLTSTASPRSIVPVSSTPPPTLASETTENWTHLFNGKDLTGWRPLPASLPVSVSQGMILIRGAADRKDAGALFYKGNGQSQDGIQQFKNFEVMTQLKISKKGNSDLVIHASPITRTAGKAVGGVGSAGVYVQIWNDGDAHVVGGPVDYLYRTGALFMISEQRTQHMNDDEWFTMRVRVEDKRLQVWLKKEGATDWIQTADWTQLENWNPPRNISQARLGSGTLAFTNWVPEDGEVWIKEVKFRSLDAVTAPVASATTWIDIQGRSIQATFVRMEGGEVQLDIAGKITPVPLNTLSSASQKVAQELQAVLVVKTDTGWVPLFPNDSLAGWTGETAPYRFTNGILTATGKGTLFSPRTYRNFVMRFEVRLGAAANNGIGIWQKPIMGAASAAEAGGFEVQLQDDSARQFSQQAPYRRHGGIYGFRAPDRQVMGARGSWNAHEIQVEDTKVTVTINGQVVLQTDLRGLRQQAPGRAELNLSEKSGHITLMSNLGTTDFRNLQIKELP